MDQQTIREASAPKLAEALRAQCDTLALALPVPELDAEFGESIETGRAVLKEFERRRLEKDIR